MKETQVYNLLNKYYYYVITYRGEMSDALIKMIKYQSYLKNKLS